VVSAHELSSENDFDMLMYIYFIFSVCAEVH